MAGDEIEDKNKPSKEEQLKSLKDQVQVLEGEVKAEPKLEHGAEPPEPKPEVQPLSEKEAVVEAESVGSMVTPINFAQTDDDDDDQPAGEVEEESPVQSIPSGDLEAQVTTLVKIALTSGIQKAIDDAQKLNSPYVMDELHDTLVDELYEQLIKMRKVDKD